MKKQTFKVRLHSNEIDIRGTFNSRASLYDFLKANHNAYRGIAATITLDGEPVADGKLDKDMLDIAEGMVIEEGITFTDNDFFRDEEEHFYTCECHDGFAECVSEENNDKANPHLKIKVEYPLLEDVLKDDEKVAAIRDYRGLSEDDEITFGDVMICYGEIVKKEIYWVDDILYWFDVDVLCIEKFGIEYNDRKITHLELDDDGVIWYWSGEPKGKGSRKMRGNEFYGLNEDILNCF